MEMNKTDSQAEAFAMTLPDAGDAQVFTDLWTRGQYDLIRGHFPAFFADEAPEEVTE